MESQNEIIEWKMIRPDGSERLLHIGKNEVKSEELNLSSTNSIILFEIYFSPKFNAYLRFYGYAPLRLNFKKIGEFSKHIYIDNNQSFVYLEQLEYTTIDVYDNEEFATFSFEKKIKKPEIDHDLIEKKKRIQWLNDNIEYEDLKKEDNEYATKSLYSQNYFNYNKKNVQSKSDKEKEQSMSEISKDKSETSSFIKEKMKDSDSEKSDKNRKSNINKKKEEWEKNEKRKEKEKEKKEKEKDNTEKNKENNIIEEYEKKGEKADNQENVNNKKEGVKIKEKKEEEESNKESEECEENSVKKKCGEKD